MLRRPVAKSGTTPANDALFVFEIDGYDLTFRFADVIAAISGSSGDMTKAVYDTRLVAHSIT